jgi:aspartyl-tRNA(Asn)/glutamyl-tRNA(Gln) amidotransferase subunit A
MTSLHELGVREIAVGVRAREFSAADVMQATLARIDATDSRVHAWVALDYEGALAAAIEADEAVARGDTRALNGVPLGVKDIYDVAGFQTRCGVDFLAPAIKERDAECVARLRRAGAIFLGKTVTTAFAYSDPPVTRNPWNEQRTPGGSSSGSAAAVGAGQLPAALGSQTYGSILRPAGYCGTVGIKPTFGRISRQGIHPLAWSLDHPGPIGRDVASVALILHHMSGFDPADPGSRDQPVEDYAAAASQPVAPRIGFVSELLELAEPDVREHTLEVVRKLESHGATVVECALPESLDLILAVHLVIMQVEAGSVHAKLHKERAEKYPPHFRALVEGGLVMPGEAYVLAQRLRSRIRAAALARLEGLDCLLMPTSGNVAPEPTSTGDKRFQGMWSLLGFPAIGIPSGLNADGLPFSTQLVARPWQEGKLLSNAAWCEGVLGRLSLPA